MDIFKLGKHSRSRYLSIDLHVVVHLSIQLLSSLGGLLAATAVAGSTATTGTTTASVAAILARAALVVARVVGVVGRPGCLTGEDGLGGSGCHDNFNSHGLACSS